MDKIFLIFNSIQSILENNIQGFDISLLKYEEFEFNFNNKTNSGSIIIKTLFAKDIAPVLVVAELDFVEKIEVLDDRIVIGIKYED